MSKWRPRERKWRPQNSQVLEILPVELPLTLPAVVGLRGAGALNTGLVKDKEEDEEGSDCGGESEEGMCRL